MREVRILENAIRQVIGRRLKVDWSKLEPDEINEVIRMINQIDHDRAAARRNMIVKPWAVKG